MHLLTVLSHQDTDSKRTACDLAQDPVKWERTQTQDGKFGPKKINLRALIAGADNVGKSSLTSAMQKYDLQSFIYKDMTYPY